MKVERIGWLAFMAASILVWGQSSGLPAPGLNFAGTSVLTAGNAPANGSILAINNGIQSATAGEIEATLGFNPAHSGANSDITSLTGLTTALSPAQGGTGGDGTGYAYGNGTSGFTYSTTIPWANVAGAPAYLPLTGGTLTGQLNGTTGNFSGEQSAVHFVGNSGKPAIALGSGAGTGATYSFIAGTDAAGIISITVGTSPGTNSPIFTLTFATPYSSPAQCVFSPGNGNAANSGVYGSADSTTTFTIYSGPALASTSFLWSYVCAH